MRTSPQPQDIISHIKTYDSEANILLDNSYSVFCFFKSFHICNTKPLLFYTELFFIVLKVLTPLFSKHHTYLKVEIMYTCNT